MHQHSMALKPEFLTGFISSLRTLISLRCLQDCLCIRQVLDYNCHLPCLERGVPSYRRTRAVCKRSSTCRYLIHESGLRI